MKQFWFNLPVKDVATSKTFYKNIGFRLNPIHEKAEHLTSFLIGEHDTVMMLFAENEFSAFTMNNVTNTKSGTEVLLNLDASSKEEVDQMAHNVEDAGGEIFAKPSEVDGWMYAMGFKDPDGHRWSMLYMDMDKMPKQ